MHFKWLTAFLLLLKKSTSDSCPGRWVFQPCHCEYSGSEAGIYCNRMNGQSIANVFNRVSTLANVYKHFDYLQIKNSSNLELNEKILGDLKFRVIKITDSNITLIESQTFESSYNFTEEFILFRSTLHEWLNNGFNLFRIIKQFSNLQKLTISQTNLKTIPENAFLRLNSTQTQLLNINLSHNRIKNIGDFAFYELSEVKFIDFSYNRVKHVSQDTFAFWKESENEIKIDLSNNYLSTKCFESLAFSKTKRKMLLILAHNNITFLDETVFLSILNNSQNKILMNNNPTVCNCKNAWILRERKTIIENLLDFLCEDGHSIFDRSYGDYYYCTLKNVDIEDNICGCGTMKMVHFLWKIGLITNYHKEHILDEFH
ncbi:hypothetical protein B4U80_14156 [Leptotrombidium deliense]|uniref:Protein slit-like protein n=1 Tax=Leptotrombidium deliense TaxID=299467 RepID=A0A443S1K5_9ACAR|nr:hypothetical protein B4U80_14156 [Leptotrombidium deliense]